jgi:hypothetical protein
MRTTIPLILLMAFLVTAGCLPDPAGMTTREQLRSHAQIEAARLQAQAAQHAATQETIRTGIVAAAIPWVALIIMAGIVIAIIAYWQGRIWHTRTGCELRVASYHPSPLAPRNSLPDLMLLAQRQGYQVEIDGPTAYLLDAAGRRIGQRSLTERRT